MPSNPIILKGTFHVYHHGATLGMREVVQGSPYLMTVT